MYRCKECSAEYEIKPDFCDCGNDEFEFINESNDLTVDKKTDTVKVDLDENPKINITKKTEPQPAPQNNYNKQQKVSLTRFSVDPLSLIIFCFCLLLSLYIVFFAWNPDETDNANSQDSKKQETTVPKNIPSVDKIWNNALPTVKTKEEKTVIENIAEQLIPPKTMPTQKEQKQTAQPKVTVVPLKKVTQTQKQTTTKTQTQKVQTAKQQTKQDAEKKSAEEKAKQKAEQERTAAEAAMLKKLQAEQAKKKAEEKAKLEKAEKEELVNYKATLRNTIGRKIDFTRVIGDGSCTVAFKIDSNGKLINRSFAKQSTNNTLNDEVYAAVMSTPVFNPPPAGYKGETLKLNIGFYNGNFEISLP